ncbi:MAG: glycosyltransferase [Bacteroidia bacterium]
MSITVVIPTYNRVGKLIQTLDSLKNQTCSNFNVLVMDDGSLDDTFQKIQHIKNTYPYKIDIYTQVNSGASKANNNALSRIKEGLIILLDDDIIASDNLIQKHIEHHEKYPQCLLSGAANTVQDSISTDIEKYKIHMENEWKKITNNGTEPLKVNFENFVITTANMSFTKEVFEAIGNFDETLRDGYDFEFGLRALCKNIPSYFDLNITSIHNDKITLRYYAKRQRCYIESKKKIFADNPDYKSFFKKETDYKINFLRKLIYQILKSNFSVNFIENSSLFKILPQQIRYKFYGSTIAALSLEL